MFWQLDELNAYRRAANVLANLVNLRDRQEEPYSVAEAYRPEGQLGLRNFVGVGIGEKIVAGRPQGVLAVCGFVVRKAPEILVAEDARMEELAHKVAGEVGDLPGHRSGGSLVSDVIEVGRPYAAHRWLTAYAPRIPGGVGIGYSSIGSGTLGCWLTERPNTRDLLLSCWHCLDSSTNTVSAQAIDQPPGSRTIASLAAIVHPERDATPGQTTVDAAVAELQQPPYQRLHPGDFLLGIGEIRGTAQVTTTGLEVLKSGASSGVTHGTIIHPSISMKLLMGTGVALPSGASSVLYEDQIGVISVQPGQSFSIPGDSGSLLMSTDHDALGLVVGGGAISLATPIDEVLLSVKGKIPGAASLDIMTYP